MDAIKALVMVAIVPGFAFLSFYSVICEWVDRKVYARLQNRKGPPFIQPVADLVKLLMKEEIIPSAADKRFFSALPMVALAAVCAAILYIPLWSRDAAFSFQGDLIVVAYLLTIPTMAFFLAGWSSSSLFSTMGSVRVLTQLYSYEVPLFLAVAGPAILAGSWSIRDIAAFMNHHPISYILALPGFAAALISLQGKLERVPFDAPEAETEIVAGVTTEYTGRLLAVFRLAIDIELVVGVAFLSAVFLGGSYGLPLWAALPIFIVKTLAVCILLSILRALLARLRIEQMVDFCWKRLAPLALFGVVVDLVAKGVGI